MLSVLDGVAKQFVLIGMLCGTTAACGDDGDGPVAMDQPDIVELAAGTADLSTLVTAVTEAELVSTLQAEGPYTVFAPVNSAFAELSEEELGRLLADENRALLQKVLTYHVVPGRVLAEDLVDGAMVTTVEGSQLMIDLDGGAKVNGVDIVRTNVTASNGVVHLIDGVLLDNLDIVDVAVLKGFDQLVAAAQAAGLVEALRGDGGGAGLTVFAPTDQAFADLGTPPSDPAVLSEVLLYHGVGGTALSTSLDNGMMLTTLQGGALEVDLTSGVTIVGANNSADVVAADVQASNGVIHAIDAVLLP